MIRYMLQCEAGHGFESWFAGGQAFDSLSRAGHLACPTCGSARVEKALMTPSLGPARKAEPAGDQASSPAPAAAPATPPSPAAIEKAIAALRREIEEKSEYVGMDFATEARRIHEGEAPERPIYGEAKPEEARKLVEEGVPVAPLPFLPRRKAN